MSTEVPAFTDQPCDQSAVLTGTMSTAALRLIASLRARLRLRCRSDAAVLTLWLITRLRRFGAPSATSTASRVTVISISTTVNPRRRRMALMGSPADVALGAGAGADVGEHQALLDAGAREGEIAVLADRGTGRAVGERLDRVAGRRGGIVHRRVKGDGVIRVRAIGGRAGPAVARHVEGVRRRGVRALLDEQLPLPGIHLHHELLRVGALGARDVALVGRVGDRAEDADDSEHDQELDESEACAAHESPFSSVGMLRMPQEGGKAKATGGGNRRMGGVAA